MNIWTNNYKKAVYQLKNQEWNRMTNEDKIRVLQSIENQIAKDEKRLPCVVKMKYIPSNREGIVMGYYTDAEQTITINSEQLDSGSKYGDDYMSHINTVIHEGRHTYQHQAVIGIINHNNHSEVSDWKENFNHYISYQKNPKRYFEQPVEVDARKYAEEITKKISADINKYEVESDNFTYNDWFKTYGNAVNKMRGMKH